MKRIALLTVLLLVVGLSLGFAQEFKPSVAWSTAGSATLTWGINLDTMETGFTNAAAGQFTVTFVPAVTLTKGADAPVYGWISLATTALTITDTAVLAGGATAVTAKIVAKPIEIGVYTFNTGALGKVVAIENSANNTDIVGVLKTAEAALATTVAGTGGTYVKFVSDMITVTGNLASIGDWTRVKDTEINYVTGVDASLVFAPVTVGLGFWQSLITASTPIAYATVAVAAAPLTLGVQMDLNLIATPVWDLGATVALAITPKTSLSAAVNYGDALTFNGLDAKVVFATTEVANLTETLTAYVLDIANAATPALPMRLVVDNTLSYKVALSDTTSVTPSLQVQYGTVMSTVAVSHLKVVAGVSAALIPNTTIALTYTSDDFIVVAPAVATMGKVTCAVTVAY